MIFVFLCLTSLSMTISRSIHVTAMALFHSFLWLSNIYITYIIYNYIIYFYMLGVYTHTEWTITHRIFFICSSVMDSGCFHILAIVNSATVNIRVQVSFWIMVFSGYWASLPPGWGKHIANSHHFVTLGWWKLSFLLVSTDPREEGSGMSTALPLSSHSASQMPGVRGGSASHWVHFPRKWRGWWNTDQSYLTPHPSVQHQLGWGLRSPSH